jgi:hypothetical protein
MTYHPLANDTGGSPADRLEERDRILKIFEDNETFGQLTQKEQEFIESIGTALAVSPKQLFWLRDIKDKYL